MDVVTGRQGGTGERNKLPAENICIQGVLLWGSGRHVQPIRSVRRCLKGDPVRALETRHIFSKQATVEQAERKS